jgi:phosphoribosylanthranilate isomerase
MTLVKICGITSFEDALVSAHCGADMLGFNFYPGSKRYIEPKAAARITTEPDLAGVSKIGVFVNAKKNEIADVSKMLRLDGIQLHGDESDEFIAELRSITDAPIIKAFRHTDRMFDEALESSATFVLLDGYSADSYGGTGSKFDWNIGQEIVNLLPHAVFLAGGLTPANVAEAIRIVRPSAVDVSSGVESSQ